MCLEATCTVNSVFFFLVLLLVTFGFFSSTYSISVSVVITSNYSFFKTVFVLFIYFPLVCWKKKIFFCFVIVDTILTDTWLTDFLLSNVLWKIKYPWVCCYGDCAARDLKIFLRFFFPCHLQCLYSRPTSTLVLNAQMLPV